MKLSFRGISYEDNSPVLEVTEAEILGRNRSQNGSFSYVRHIPVPQSLNLKERGAIDRTNQTQNANPTPAVQLVVTGSETKLSFNKNQKTVDEADLVHQANIRRNLEHRLRVAKAREDKNLLRLLEAESEQLTFCASTSPLAS